MSDIGRRIDAVVRAGLAPALKAAGFRKTANTFRRAFPLGVQVVSVQSSQWNAGQSGRFTVNLGVYLPAVAALDGHPHRPKPAHYHCQVSRRIGFLLPRPHDKWWELTSGSDDTATAANLGWAWERAGPAWFAAREQPAALIADAAGRSGWVGCKVALGLGDRLRAGELWRDVWAAAGEGFVETVEAFGRRHGFASSAAVRRVNPS